MEENATENNIKKCIVIGAGLSGLTCANDLISKYGFLNSDLLVLEANDYIGGRVKTCFDFVEGEVIELGAEFLHGEKTCLYKKCEELKLKTEKFFCTSQGDGGPDTHPVNNQIGRYFVKHKDVLNAYDYNSDNQSFKHAHSVIHNITNEACRFSNVSMLQYLEDNNVSEEMIALLEAGYANTCCSTLENLSLSKLAEWNTFWANQAGEDDSERYIVPPFSLQQVVESLKRGLDIKLSSAVEKIEMQKDQLIKICTEHETYFARSVVVSVSAGVLKDRLINFRPPLPIWKLSALNSVDFCPAMKIIMCYKKPFWNRDIDGIVCGGLPIPELWPAGLNHAMLIGFVTSAAFLRLENETTETIFSLFSAQMSELFPRYDRSLFVKGLIFRWDRRNKYIRGGYSSPKHGVDFCNNYSELLAKPIDNRIFFCGEATNSNEGSTMPSAMDSGSRAAKEVAASLID